LSNSITQLCAEAAKSLPRTKYGRPDPLATSRMKAELHLKFWLPIAEMLDPRDRSAKAGGSAQDFYSRGQGILRPHEIEESLALMRRYLGTPRLPFNIWFQLRPIFQDLLSEALTKADADIVACAVRQYARLSLGQPADPDYGLVDPSVTNLDGPWYDRCTDDEHRYSDESDSEFASWSNGDWKIFASNKAWQILFDDADEFLREFPKNARDRLNMARALRPIFDRAWITDWWLTKDVLPYVKALLAIDFRKGGLASLPDAVVTEVA
jgi:hypothetical protein